MMIVKTVPVCDAIETNAYFFIDEKTNHGFLIDPGAEADVLLDIITKNNWVIEKILITHGHFDHIGAVEEIHKKLHIPYIIHVNGKKYLEDPHYNLSFMGGGNIRLFDAEYVNDGAIICDEAQQIELQVISAPGHTEDGVIYYNKEQHIAFVGDTIFKHSIGRTDFPGGDMKTLYQTIQNKVFSLPDDTKLYSGHTDVTTVLDEKKYGFGL